MMKKQKKINLEIRILDAATEIINERGLEKLTARSVAERAGCSIGSLYNYFHDMNALILRINANTLLGLQKAISQAIKNTKNHQKLGKEMGRRYLSFAQNHFPFWNLLFRYKIPAGESLPRWYQELIDSNFRLLETALMPLVEKKHLHRTSRILWGACHGIVALSVDGKLDIASKESAETLCESLFENYLKGIG